MGWRIVKVTDEADREEGFAIFDSVCGAFVRPCVNHPQSVFDEETANGIADYLAEKYGDPRRAEHLLTDDELKAIGERVKHDTDA